MEQEVIVQISNKLKSIRKEKNLTLQEVAEKAGVTKGLISQIENSRTIPSLLVLIQIVKALGIGLDEFFNDLNFYGKEGRILVQRQEDYEKFEKEGSGYEYFRIFSKKINACTLDIVLLEIQPGAVRDLVQTDAFEYKYVISGTVRYLFRDQEIDLHPGDSMLFDGRIEHNPLNIGTEKVRMLVVYFFES